MFGELKDKVEYEFNRFKGVKLCESRQAIFTASHEIETKKKIRNRLLEGYGIEVDARLLEIPDLLDTIYQELILHMEEPYTDSSIDICALGLAQKM